MGKTSSEVKQRWNEKTYRRLTLYLRKEEDKAYIDYLDKRRSESDDSLAVIVKEALDLLMAEGSVQNWK
jgi:hypothetical protein